MFGTDETAKCYERVLAALIEFDIQQRQTRARISMSQMQIKQLDEQFANNQRTMTEINNYLQNMKPTGLLGSWTENEKQQIANLQQQFGQLNTANAGIAGQRNALHFAVSESQRQFIESFMIAAQETDAVTLDLLVSIRNELGIPFKDDTYSNVFRSRRAEVIKKVRAMLNQSSQPIQPV